MTAGTAAKRRTKLTTFTIDADNNITAFPTPDLAAGAVGAGAQPFGSQQELAELAAVWPADRLVAVWNSLPGDIPVKKFKDSKTAISRIWARIQHLGQPEKPKAKRKARVGAQAAKGAPAKAKANKKATPAKKAPKPGIYDTTVPVWVVNAERSFEVVFAGDAPGLVAGVMQINFRLPDSLTGNTFAFFVEIGGVSTVQSQIAVVQ